MNCVNPAVYARDAALAGAVPSGVLTLAVVICLIIISILLKSKWMLIVIDPRCT